MNRFWFVLALAVATVAFTSPIWAQNAALPAEVRLDKLVELLDGKPGAVHSSSNLEELTGDVKVRVLGTASHPTANIISVKVNGVAAQVYPLKFDEKSLSADRRQVRFVAEIELFDEWEIKISAQPEGVAALTKAYEKPEGDGMGGMRDLLEKTTENPDNKEIKKMIKASSGSSSKDENVVVKEKGITYRAVVVHSFRFALMFFLFLAAIGLVHEFISGVKRALWRREAGEIDPGD